MNRITTYNPILAKVLAPVFKTSRKLKYLIPMMIFVITLSGKSQAQCPNLIKNGDFSLGNTGFTSDLAYQGNACAAGHYFVGTKFTDECSGWNSSLNPNQNDHTTGSGKFLIIDGNNKNAADVWKKSLSNVCKGDYTLSFWAKNVYGAGGAFPLGVYINGVLVTTVTINTAGWTQYTVSWSGAPTSIALRQMTAGEKRDFGIDDIYLADCPGACTPQ